MIRLVNEGKLNLFNKLSATADQDPQDHYTLIHADGESMDIGSISKVEWQILMDENLIVKADNSLTFKITKKGLGIPDQPG